MLDVPPAPDNADTDTRLWLQDVLRGVFAVEDITTGAVGGRSTRVRGRFLIDSGEAYAQLAPRFRAQGRTLLVRSEGGDTFLVIVDSVVKPTPNNVWLPVLLAILTVLSMLFSQALANTPGPSPLMEILRNLGTGWSFALSLISILLGPRTGALFHVPAPWCGDDSALLYPFPNQSLWHDGRHDPHEGYAA